MNADKDYSKMTLDELVSEEKKMNSQKTITALLIGFFVGVAVWAAVHKSSFLPITLVFFAYLIGSGYAKNLKSIQAEISRRDSVG